MTAEPKKPTDLGQDFIASGMRLITQQSSDHLLSDLDQGRPQTQIGEVEFWHNEFPELSKQDIQDVLTALDDN